MDQTTSPDAEEGPGLPIGEWARMAWARKASVLGCLVLGGALGIGVSYLIAPTFTAKAVIIPPQSAGSSAAAAALGSLGSLAGLAGGAGLRNTAEQYVALMQSATVADALIDQFKLVDLYKADYRVDARKKLTASTVIQAGKKDGLITIEVSDKSPQRAADMANAYVDGLRMMTNRLAVTEAQQRRVFFEQKLSETKDRLTQAQVVLQSSGFSAGALKAEPRSAAEAYARLRAEATAAEVKLQTMRRSLADGSPALQQQQALLGALRGELARLEQQDANPGGGADYVTKYREFKYQETLFDLFAKQYELARVDESREGGLIQVVDKALPPERKSKPKRAYFALVFGFLAALGFVVHTIRRGGRRALAV